MIDMKIAIPVFGNRISPRFDFSPELWILTLENKDLVNEEKIPTINLNLPRRLEQIASRRVDKVICGGIDSFSLSQLESRGIDVVQDVMGETEAAFELFVKGRLRSGCCCEGGKGESFCAWSRGSGGRRA